jgi:regulator of sirC expression with transglutaminase-like and TPR domain
MSSQLDLALFAHVCSSLEQHFADAALLISAIEYPDLDVARYLKLLDELGAGVREATGAPTGEEAGDEARLERAVLWLYDEAGFHGNTEDYYDPRNSFLNEVIDRRTGIPISLAIVLLEACQRAEIPAYGVSFPSHFLVRSGPGGLIIDPFAGRPLSHEELWRLYTRVTGESREPPERLLVPASKTQILIRMLGNLRGIYAARSDVAHLVAVLERMQVLAPNEELAREIQRLGGTTPRPSSMRSGSHRLN